MSFESDKKTVRIYSKPYCVFCTKAKNFLTEKKVPFEYIELDPLSDEYDDQKDDLVSKTSHKSFPFIFVGNTFVGGYTELLQSFNTLRFHELCMDVGIKVDMDF